MEIKEAMEILEKDIHTEVMEKFAEEHAAEIEQKKAELKEGGWYE